MRSDVPQERDELTPESPISAVSILFNGNPLAIWIYDATTFQFLDANESALSQYGYTREDFLQLTLSDVVLSAQQLSLETEDVGVRSHANVVQRHLRSDGTQIDVAVRSNDVSYGGKPCKLVIAEDVTERRHVDAELIQMAHHDALTGLPNRMLLSDRMAQALSTAQRLKHKTAVISIDLDHFKKVNDWYGHAIGDAYLKHVAGLLTSRLRGMDTVARMGGDEFAIVLGEISTVESAGLVGKMLLQALNKPTVIGGYTIQPRGSLGIAIYPEHGSDMDEVWRCADAAMYRAKRAGGNRYIVAGPDASSSADDSAALDKRLREMLEKERLLLHYQLQYSPNDAVRGMEALLRMQDIGQGYVSPDRIIARAEDNGMIYPVGRCVVEEVCRQMDAWKSVSPSPIRVAVNVSPSQLMRKEFASEVADSLAKWKIDPSCLEMEITERAILNFDEISTEMHKLSGIGVRFAVDDFGTGYSSLQHLHRLPISAVKIDRSFVQRLCDSSSSYPIVKAIIAVGHSMKMEVIAEGVEQEEQRVILDRLGCDGMQGYLFAKPMSPEEISKSLVTVRRNTGTDHKISPPSIRQPAARQVRPISA
ncbi:MAG: EAL domain-containing protein [Acidobacteriaceae bacterium]|jgi:diguanylate cyclase (GGDEF)-like protein/PAS domain S-box-containing protein